MRKFAIIGLALVAVALLAWGGKTIYMRIKNGAEIENLEPEIKAAFPAIEDVFGRFGIEPVLTAGTDGTHMKGSYHYLGLAVDLRLASRIDPGQDDAAIRAELAAALGPDYDVILESDHFHVEYDAARVAKNSKGIFTGRG